MRWPELHTTVADTFQPPDGYLLEQLTAEDVEQLASALSRWYPDIAVGAESSHLDPAFYREHCFLQGGDSQKPIFCFVFKHSGSIVAMASIEKDDRALSVISRMGSAAPEHRNQGLAHTAPVIIEALARKMGAELLHHVVTLKTVHQQRVAEKHGYVLAGIIPGNDRDLVAPNTVRRVYEALYVKLLVPQDALVAPAPDALTPRTRAAWQALFGTPPP